MRTAPPLLESDIEAICRHFGSGVVGAGNVEPRGPGHGTVSYDAFLAWIDPVDVARVAKR